MSASVILIAGLASSPVIKDGMNEAERIKAISPFVKPSPGESVSVDEGTIHEAKYKSDPLFYKVYVEFSPPKGHCFTITRSLDIADLRICKKTKVALPVGEVKSDGSFTWRISTGKGDFGHKYTWQTPHRIAQKIPATTKQVSYVPVHSCNASIEDGKKEITLKLMDGDIWSIRFPEKDTLETQPRQLPNLWVGGRTIDGGISEDSSLEAENRDPWAYRNNVKPNDPVTKHWSIHERNQYRMTGPYFSSGDTAPGLNPTCRYQYAGADKDPQSGWIECHNTADYEVIFTHLTCAKDLKSTVTN